MDEFERMGIVSKEAALERLLQVVEKLYPGSDIPSALIRFHKNTTRKGVLCPIVIASVSLTYSCFFLDFLNCYFFFVMLCY